MKRLGFLPQKKENCTTRAKSSLTRAEVNLTRAEPKVTRTNLHAPCEPEKHAPCKAN